MRLFQHDEFPNIVAAAAAARSLDEAFVEKDYYITEILRIVAGRYQPGQMIFKGGTSLSKAWGLIERLSEDVDSPARARALRAALEQERRRRRAEGAD